MKLGRVQREKLKQFVNITGAGEKFALQFLNASDWHLESAFEDFYGKPLVKCFSERVLDLYAMYKNQYDDMITVDGICQLCNDIEVDPQDAVMLVVSWHMNAATMCEYSKKEFIHGLHKLRIDSVETFREKVPALQSELKDEEKFRKIYNYAFGWAKEKGQKFLPLDTAIAMWQLLFAEKPWTLFDHWCEFVQTQFGNAITQDTWSQLLEFARNVGPENISNYDAESAWPCLIDEFVEYLNDNGILDQLKDWGFQR